MDRPASLRDTGCIHDVPGAAAVMCEVLHGHPREQRQHIGDQSPMTAPPQALAA